MEFLGCWRIPPGGCTDWSGPVELYRHGDTGRGHIPSRDSFPPLCTPCYGTGRTEHEEKPLQFFPGRNEVASSLQLCARVSNPHSRKKDTRINPTFPQNYGIYPETQLPKLILSFPCVELAACTDQANNNRGMSLPCHLLAGESFIWAAKRRENRKELEKLTVETRETGNCTDSRAHPLLWQGVPLACTPKPLERAGEGPLPCSTRRNNKAQGIRQGRARCPPPRSALLLIPA